jgi:SNF2 family DNA or RNA helicase
MTRLEDITRGAQLAGILPGSLVTVVDVKWYGSAAVELTYKDPAGNLDHELLYRNRELDIEIAGAGSTNLPWSFDGDGDKLRLVSEAYRTRLAYLFDPLLAVHTSIVDPLPHQITAVYGQMLTHQPLRFLLADDPGAGKTVMTGLLIKELLIRGDVRRCLVVCPGNLVEQWQDELYQRFGLNFSIITREAFNNSRSGNPFSETNLAICRLDHLSRNEDIQAKLSTTDWDLIVCDEAHKMSASYFSGEVTYTKRYRLAQLLSRLTRHFLLLTATPHNGKEGDFQLFMALIDPDRFEGKYRPGVHSTDASDLMRRLVKEELVKFDNTPLFPERWAYTVNYELSAAEAKLYEEVTEYVRQEFNRVEALQNNKQKGTVGFALMILQRRLASSPEAIYQSLKRRRERLEARLRQERLQKHRQDAAQVEVDLTSDLPDITPDDWDEFDESPGSELESAEEEIVDQATTARTIAELEIEIASLRRLEELAYAVRVSGRDKKWEELSKLLQDRPEMFDTHGSRRKLIVFTEHRDTLNYLRDRIVTLLGRPEAVVTIHGAMNRQERHRAEDAFRQNKEVQILVATDAAGEGINLQRANLMVNYDLPWNPNRIEQRFGRIHRIGQTEVCFLWNLVAEETREGYVYNTLLRKMEAERKALGGGVYDVLGKAIDGVELRNLLLDAIRYGDRPDVRARLHQQVSQKLDTGRLRDLLEERALAHDVLNAAEVRRIREDMERAQARRLQPHFIASFFLEAFRLLDGSVREREKGRYEITHVPHPIRSRSSQLGTGMAVLPRYERITFDKNLRSVDGKPPADMIAPGHPLLDATIDLVLERYGDLLKRGAILVDPNDEGDEPRLLCYLEHSVVDARADRSDNRRPVSQRMQFVEASVPTPDGRQLTFHNAGPAPYLDYRPPTEAEREKLRPLLQRGRWHISSPEDGALQYAIEHLVPQHFEEVRARKHELVEKARAAVHERLTKEIMYWDRRARELKQQEKAGKVNARLNSGLAEQRRDDLEARLKRRMEDLDQEKRLSALPPVVIGGALVVPAGLLRKLAPVAGDGRTAPTHEEEPVVSPEERRRIELLAMQAVMQAETLLGYIPRDVSDEKVGYDVESSVPGTGRLRFVEVKGRVAGAHTVTVTRNEIMKAINVPDDFVLAIVQVENGVAGTPRYVRRPFRTEPDFGATSVNYDLADLLARAQDPS